jgi:hypothetical protein
MEGGQYRPRCSTWYALILSGAWAILHEMYAKREWRRCCVPVDNGVTLEEVAIASSDVIAAIAKFVAETAVNCGAGRVECSLPFDHPCARFLAHVGPAVGT